MPEFTPAEKQYNRRVLVAMMGYGGVIAAHYYANPARGDLLAAVFAVLAALPVMGVFVALARYLSTEKDEYIRVRTVRQLLWATGGMLGVTTLWGFLGEAGAPQPPLHSVAIIWFACMGIASLFRMLVEKLGHR